MSKVLTRTIAIAFALALCGSAFGQSNKPNILILSGDDIGYWNLSAYNHTFALDAVLQSLQTPGKND